MTLLVVEKSPLTQFFLKLQEFGLHELWVSLLGVDEFGNDDLLSYGICM